MYFRGRALVEVDLWAKTEGNGPSDKTVTFFFFFETGVKNCDNLLIKKKIIIRLINGKPNKNRYNKTTRETTPKVCNL
jgi:hypothetical protein